MLALARPSPRCQGVRVSAPWKPGNLLPLAQQWNAKSGTTAWGFADSYQGTAENAGDDDDASNAAADNRTGTFHHNNMDCRLRETSRYRGGIGAFASKQIRWWKIAVPLAAKPALFSLPSRKPTHHHAMEDAQPKRKKRAPRCGRLSEGLGRLGIGSNLCHTPPILYPSLPSRRPLSVSLCLFLLQGEQAAC